jgi:hypothetical protein
MTREELDAAYELAQSNYQQAIELMNADELFMKALPDKLDVLINKGKALHKEATSCRSVSASRQRLAQLSILLDRISEFNAGARAFIEESFELRVRSKELIAKYNTHSGQRKSNLTTGSYASEWVTQLNETATALLETTRQFNSRLAQIRQHYNLVVQQAQPYLN